MSGIICNETVRKSSNFVSTDIASGYIEKIKQ